MDILFNILTILGSAILIVCLSRRFRLPTVVGFLITGMAIGPHGFGLVTDPHQVEVLAEVGIVLLLFTIGLEFSLKKLLSMKRLALLGGTLQMGLTIAAAMLVTHPFLSNYRTGIFLGFLFALSSTAIVLKLFQERGEIVSPHGRVCLGVLIYQDIAMVPLILAVPFLAGQAGGFGMDTALLVGKGLALVLLILASAVWIVPRLLHYVARTRDREIFLLAVVVICFTVAWATYSIGLSLALGAFLAGLVISDSEYSYQTVASVLPFKDVFSCFFFISIGMILDLSFVADKLHLVLLSLVGVVLLKALAASGACLLLGLPLRTSILAGLLLSQIGEFSFLLSREGVRHHLLSADGYTLFLAVTVLSMVLTPFFFAKGPSLADRIAALPILTRIRKGLYQTNQEELSAEHHALKDHLVIIGFGLNGRQLAKAAKTWRIPYVIVELNPETVAAEKKHGEPIFYGDASHAPILAHACIAAARVVVVAVPDPIAVRRITKLARDLAPKAEIIVRTKYFQEYDELLRLGASQVIPEEYETAIEIFARVIERYYVPPDEVAQFIAAVRADGYAMTRAPSVSPFSLCEFTLPNMEIRRHVVAEGSPVVGRSIEELAIRKRHHVTILAVRRDGDVNPSPGADTVFAAGDVVLAAGTDEALRQIRALFLPASGVPPAA